MRTIQVMRTIKQNRWGGIESVVIETGKRLIQSNHEVKIYCSPKPSSVEEESIQGVPIQRLSMLSPYIQETDIDIIHWHQGYRLAKMMMKVSKKFNIPYIMSMHNGIESMDSYKQFLEKKYNWFSLKGWKEFERGLNMYEVYRNASALFLIGLDEHKIAQELFPNKPIFYCPNGVDPNRFSKGDGAKFRETYHVPHEAELISCISRIDRNKDQLLLVEALKIIRNSRKNIYLALIGSVTDPPYYESLEYEIQNSGLKEFIRLIPGISGYTQELVDAYSAADIFVLPSLCEPFGIVILEAWCARKPVITTNAGGVPYFVKNGENGLLFEPQNLDELLSCFDKLWSHPNLSTKLADSGHQKVQKEYNWDMITKRQIGIYKDVIKSYYSKTKSSVEA